MTQTEYTLSQLPPSTNHLFANVPGKGRVKTGKYRKWLKAMSEEMLTQGPRPNYQGPVGIEIRAYRTRSNRDLSNLIKPTEDLMVTMGVMGDDRQVVDIHARWEADMEGVRVIVREY